MLHTVIIMCANINVCTYVPHMDVMCFHVRTLCLCACAVMFADFFALCGFCAFRFAIGGHCMYTCIRTCTYTLSYCMTPHSLEEVATGKRKPWPCLNLGPTLLHRVSAARAIDHARNSLPSIALCIDRWRAAVLRPLSTCALRLACTVWDDGSRPIRIYIQKAMMGGKRSWQGSICRMAETPQ